MTVRDVKVLEFLTDFKIARTTSIATLFFENRIRVAQRRLQRMEKDRLIKHVNENGYVYYTDLPKQYIHSIALTDYIAHLSKVHKIENMKHEYKHGSIRVDALVTLDGSPTFIEMQLSGAPDVGKFLKYKVSKEWEKEFTKFPNIRIVGNPPPQNYGLNIVSDCPKSCTYAIR